MVPRKYTKPSRKHHKLHLVLVFTYKLWEAIHLKVVDRLKFGLLEIGDKVHDSLPGHDAIGKG